MSLRIAIAFCLCALPLTEGVAASSWLVRTWDTDDGLPQNSIVSLAQGSDGRLWAGTLLGGVAVFDGIRFLTFDPSNTPQLRRLETQHLVVGAEGAVWILQLGGSLARWERGVFTDETDDRWSGEFLIKRLFDTTKGGTLALRRGGELLRRIGTAEWEALEIDRSETDDTRFFAMDTAGRFYFRTRELGLGWWENGESGVIPLDGIPGDTIRAMTIGSDGRLWVGTELGIGEISTGAIIDHTPSAGIGEIMQMSIARDGALWVRELAQLRRFSSGTWTAVAKNLPPEILSDRRLETVQMLAAEGGGLWVLHRHAGVWHVDTEGETANVVSEDGLPSGLVQSGLVDREGSLWVGFSGGGLARIRPRFLDLLSAPEVPRPVVRSICEGHDGSLWTGHADGRLVRWREGKGEIVPLPRSESTVSEGVQVRDIIVWPDNSENLWIGTVGSGAWILRDGQFRRPFPPAATGTVVRAGLCDRHGTVWMGSEHGLFRYANNELSRFTAADGFNGKYVLALTEAPDGSIWVGTAEGGLWRWDGEKFDLWRLPGEQEYRFWALHASGDDTVWIGTLAAGLLRWKDGDLGRATSADGLPSDTVTQILTDSNGLLWAGSRHGLFSLKVDELHRFFDGQRQGFTAREFTLSSGLPAMEFSGGFHPACTRTSDGKLWFSTVKGALAVTPDEVPFNPHPPPVLIEEMRIDGRAQREPITEGSSISLPPGKHNCEFRFTAPSLVAPEEVRFEWRLEGFESEWVDGDTSRLARYASLGAGSYIFRVRACNNDRVWNEIGAAVSLTIAPYYWQTLWFKILAPLAILAAAALGVWAILRRKHLKELETISRLQLVQAERTRIARDLHDDLGASLTQLTWLCESAETQPGSEKQEQLEHIGSKSRDMVRSIDEIVWAVTPHNDTLDALAHYVCQFAEEFLGSTSIRCRLDVDEALPDCVLDSIVRHDLFLVAREAIHNAARHSGADEVNIDIHASASEVMIRIADNGRGFDPETLGSGNGLRNMRERASAAQAGFELETQPGAGCAVILKIGLYP